MESGTAPLTVWDGALRRFSELARENGFTGIVSYTPPAYATYGGQLKLADPSLAPLLVSFDEAQRRYFAERTASDGLLFFDLTPALRAAAAHPDSTGLLYGPVHVHLTARGNEVVADALSRFLEDEGWFAPRRHRDRRCPGERSPCRLTTATAVLRAATADRVASAYRTSATVTPCDSSAALSVASGAMSSP